MRINPTASGRLLALAAALVAIPPAGAAPSFHRDILPVLQRSCQSCHMPSMKSGGLDLTTFEGFAAGGKHGAGFTAGAPQSSLAIRYLTGEAQPRMPMGLPPLPPEQIQLIKDWIAAGATNDTPALNPSSVEPVRYHQLPVIMAIAYSPDGKALAVAGNYEVLIHSLASDAAAIRRLRGGAERILSLEFSADGKTLMAGGGTPARLGEIQLWNFETGKLIRSMAACAGDTAFGASLSPDGSRVAAGCPDNTVRILDASSGKELHKIGHHENWVLDTVFGADGKRLVSVSRDRAAKLTDAASGAMLENINLLRSELTAVARQPGKDVVVIGGEDRVPYIYLMDRPRNMKIADDTTLIKKLERQNGAIFALAWSADGKLVAVGGAAPEIGIYDAASGDRIAAAKGHTAGIYSLAFSPDSQTLAAAGFDGQVRFYKTADGSLARALVPVPLEPATQARRQP